MIDTLRVTYQNSLARARASIASAAFLRAPTSSMFPKHRAIIRTAIKRCSSNDRRARELLRESDCIRLRLSFSLPAIAGPRINFVG